MKTKTVRRKRLDEEEEEDISEMRTTTSAVGKKRESLLPPGRKPASNVVCPAVCFFLHPPSDTHFLCFSHLLLLIAWFLADFSNTAQLLLLLSLRGVCSHCLCLSVCHLRVNPSVCLYLSVVHCQLRQERSHSLELEDEPSKTLRPGEVLGGTLRVSCLIVTSVFAFCLPLGLVAVCVFGPVACPNPPLQLRSPSPDFSLRKLPKINNRRKALPRTAASHSVRDSRPSETRWRRSKRSPLRRPNQPGWLNSIKGGPALHAKAFSWRARPAPAEKAVL